jgi:hypothetical protein
MLVFLYVNAGIMSFTRGEDNLLDIALHGDADLFSVDEADDITVID